MSYNWEQVLQFLLLFTLRTRSLYFLFNHNEYTSPNIMIFQRDSYVGLFRSKRLFIGGDDIEGLGRRFIVQCAYRVNVTIGACILIPEYFHFSITVSSSMLRACLTTSKLDFSTTHRSRVRAIKKIVTLISFIKRWKWKSLFESVPDVTISSQFLACVPSLFLPSSLINGRIIASWQLLLN